MKICVQFIALVNNENDNIDNALISMQKGLLGEQFCYKIQDGTLEYYFSLESAFRFRIVHECHCILQLSPIWTTHKKLCQCNKALQGKGCSEASGNHSYILMYLPKSTLLFLTHSHRTYRV